jgi:hypothetical protein
MDYIRRMECHRPRRNTFHMHDRYRRRLEFELTELLREAGTVNTLVPEQHRRAVMRAASNVNEHAAFDVLAADLADVITYDGEKTAPATR